MKNFVYAIPTKILFGEGQIQKLTREIKPYGNKVLMVYGGGSIKKNGVYDTIVDSFKENRIAWVEFPGVEPNPRVSTVRKGIQVCRENQIDAIVAVGGGSSIDCAKVIAGGVYYDGDPWDIVVDGSKVIDALPVFCVLTLAATGTEMNCHAVISNMDTNDKLPTKNPKLFPKCSVMDPTYTYTVPKEQTAAGTADIMSHTFENYFSRVRTAYVQDRMAESVLKTCIQYGRKAMDEPENYEARANLMWAGSIAINGLLALGKPVPWGVHAMEHQLSACYDVTHGVGLAILTPRWMKHALNQETAEQFAEYGKNVWDIDARLTQFEIAKLAIEKTENLFFNELEIPSTLTELGIGDERFEEMAEKIAAMPTMRNAFLPLDKEVIMSIYRDCL